jgi:hypothetical protein
MSTLCVVDNNGVSRIQATKKDGPHSHVKTFSFQAHLVCKVIHCEIQLVCNKAAWLTRAHHELIELALAKGTLFTVILLIRTMKLHELHCFLGNVRFLVHKLRHQGVPQEVTLLLDYLHFASLRKSRGWGFRRSCNMTNMRGVLSASAPQRYGTEHGYN